MLFLLFVKEFNIGFVQTGKDVPVNPPDIVPFSIVPVVSKLIAGAFAPGKAYTRFTLTSGMSKENSRQFSNISTAYTRLPSTISACFVLLNFYSSSVLK